MPSREGFPARISRVWCAPDFVEWGVWDLMLLSE